MGNVCGAAPNVDKNTAGQASASKPTSLPPVTSMNKLSPRAKASDDDESWRTILLSDVVLVKSIHPHPLEKFMSADGQIPDSARNQKSEASKVAAAGGDDDEDSYYEDDSTWLCDGSQRFVSGCKSGQTDFDEHLGIEGWSSKEDFDLCEMCIRWVVHCEKA